MSATTGLSTWLPKAHLIPRCRLLVPRVVANTMTLQGPSIPRTQNTLEESLQAAHALRVSLNTRSLRWWPVQNSQQNFPWPNCLGMAGTPLLRDIHSHGGWQPLGTLSSLGAPPGEFPPCPSQSGPAASPHPSVLWPFYGWDSCPNTISGGSTRPGEERGLLLWRSNNEIQ